MFCGWRGCGGVSIYTGKYGVKSRASSSRSCYNKFAPHKNEQWGEFSVQLARTTGGRLNDYVTTTALQLSENNNHGLGRILRPSKIKGEWEPDRQREGGREGEWETDFMEITRGATCLWLCCRVEQVLCSEIHTLYGLTEGGGTRDKLPLCPTSYDRVILCRKLSVNQNRVWVLSTSQSLNLIWQHFPSRTYSVAPLGTKE